MLADQREHSLYGRPKCLAAPIAIERRIEHFAEPMQDHLAAGLANEAPIDCEIVFWTFGEPAECAARHQYNLSAMLLDMAALFFIGADDIVGAARFVGGELVGAGATGEVGAWRCPSEMERSIIFWT